MKKLLVLSLVLGFASLASAALSFDLTTGLEVNDSGNPDGGSVIALLGISTSLDGAVSVTDDLVAGLKVEQYLGEFDMSSMGLPAEWGTMDVWSIGWGSTDPYDAGNYATATTTAAGWGVADLQAGTAVLLNADNPSDIYDVAYAVPEPATMALLGLGALALRRKK